MESRQLYRKLMLLNIFVFRLRRHVLPIVVWLAVLSCVIVLFHNRTGRFEVLGIARGRVHQVSAPVDCQVKTVSVELFDSVYKGQTLATLDKSQLNAQIDAIYAEAKHLKAQLISIEDTMQAEAANLKSDRIADQRTFLVDVENARIRILELKTLIETDKVTLEDLSIELKIAEELLAKGAVSPYELQKAQALCNALAKKIEENQNLLAQAHDIFLQAQKDYQQSVDLVKLQVRQAYRDLIEAADRYQLQLDSLNLARKRFDNTLDLLQYGRTNTRDVLDAQEDLFEAHDQATGALVDYTVATLNFYRDTGVLQVRHDGMWQQQIQRLTRK